jgi:hypothetical protein
VIRLTSHPVELASGSHRLDGVVVGCASLDVFQSHPEYCIRMALIQPDMTLWPSVSGREDRSLKAGMGSADLTAGLMCASMRRYVPDRIERTPTTLALTLLYFGNLSAVD